MERFPAIEPHDTGMLAVSDGQHIHWEVSGNPHGRPVVMLHGGPGSGLSRRMCTLFDPHRWRIIQFDQRGCGASTPSSADIDTDLSVNTTDHLIADIEALRVHLGVDRWTVSGGSWGSTLGLAYAQAHRDRVTALVLFSVVATTADEVRWITRDMARLFPEQWQRFRAGAADGFADDNLTAGYVAALADPDPAVRQAAAAAWCDWEDTHVSVFEYEHDTRYDDPRFRMCFARLVTHYWANTAWRDGDALIDGADVLAGLPGALITGARDVSGPPDIAWRIAQRWPDAELVIVGDAAHGTGYRGIAEALMRTFARLAE